MTPSPQDRNMRWFRLVVVSVIGLVLTGVVAYRFATTPLYLTIDFPTLLSLLLAVFSVSLAALFYFKATETSNTFYDNTYRFTRETAELLARIESGFGERLRHLDESYTKIQDRFLIAPSKEDVVQVEQNIEVEEKTIAAKVEEREKLIDDLLRKSKLDEKQKGEFRRQLADKDEQLRLAKEQLETLLAQVKDLVKVPELLSREERKFRAVTEYLRIHVVHRLEREYILTGSLRLINRRWAAIRGTLSPAFLSDMETLGFVGDDRQLTPNGFRTLKEVAQSAPSPREE